jgi:hypothetical protein
MPHHAVVRFNAALLPNISGHAVNAALTQGR